MLSLMKRWSEYIRQFPSATHATKPDIGVYATWETTVEEFVLQYTSNVSGQSLSDIGRGTADLSRIESAMIQALGENFVVIGQASNLASEGDGAGEFGKSPTLYDLYQNLTYLTQFFTIRFLFIDYLQKIPDLDGLLHSDKAVSVVRDNTNRIISISRQLSLPTVVGVQARREVDDYPGLKLPLMTDGQWCSSIEQDFHKVWSISKPSLYFPVGQRLDLPQRDLTSLHYELTDNSFGFRSLKQRYGFADYHDRWLLDMEWAELYYTTHLSSFGGDDY